MYVGKTYDAAKSKADHRMWKRRFAREFLKGPVHEFRTWKELIQSSGPENPIVKTTPNRTFKHVKVGYRKPKAKVRTANDPIVGCLWEKLADCPGQALSDFRDRIEGYAYSYNAGFDPLTGNSLKDVKSFEFYIEKSNGMEEKAVPKAFDEFEASQKAEVVTEAFSPTRNNVVPDPEVMKLLLDLICDDDFKKKVEGLTDRPKNYHNFNRHKRGKYTGDFQH